MRILGTEVLALQTVFQNLKRLASVKNFTSSDSQETNPVQSNYNPIKYDQSSDVFDTQPGQTMQEN